MTGPPEVARRPRSATQVVIEVVPGDGFAPVSGSEPGLRDEDYGLSLPGIAPFFGDRDIRAFRRLSRGVSPPARRRRTRRVLSRRAPPTKPDLLGEMLNRLFRARRAVMYLGRVP